MNDKRARLRCALQRVAALALSAGCSPGLTHAEADAAAA
jgi:hypothetical protein